MKRVARFLVSCAVFAVLWIIRSVRLLLGLPLRPTAVVLYYHAVSDAEKDRFAAQMDHLLRVCKPVPAGMDSELEAGCRYAAVTFDDGLESVARNALPVLSKRNIPCTLFMVADLLGRKANWGEYHIADGSQESVISAEQLRCLPRESVTIGSHTLTHPVLTAVQPHVAEREIMESRAQLEKLLGYEVRLFSFPYGKLNEQLVRICAAAGYTRLFSHLPRFAFSEPGEFLTSRVKVDPSDWFVEFRLKLAGAYSWRPLTDLWRKRSLRRRVIRENLASISCGD